MYLQGSLLQYLLNWGSLLTTVPLNLCLPCLLFVLSSRIDKSPVSTGDVEYNAVGGSSNNEPLCVSPGATYVPTLGQELIACCLLNANVACFTCVNLPMVQMDSMHPHITQS